LSIAQIQALLEQLREPVRTMVLVDVSTGLRIGELLALQWRDIDFENLEISVTRSISLQHRRLQDGSFTQTDPDGCRTRRSALAMAAQ
jgi:integrase